MEALALCGVSLDGARELLEPRHHFDGEQKCGRQFRHASTELPGSRPTLSVKDTNMLPRGTLGAHALTAVAVGSDF